MTREERHIAVLSRLLENMEVYDSVQPTEERKKAIKAAIKALSQEPCDAISRADALEVASEECQEFRGIYGRIEDGIQKLPPVTPSRPTEHKPICDDCIYFADGKGSEKCDSCELTGTNKPSRRKGHWIKVIDDNGISDSKSVTVYHYECSECNAIDWQNGKSNYCFNCGAEMTDNAQGE